MKLLKPDLLLLGKMRKNIPTAVALSYMTLQWLNVITSFALFSGITAPVWTYRNMCSLITIGFVQMNAGLIAVLLINKINKYDTMIWSSFSSVSDDYRIINLYLKKKNHLQQYFNALSAFFIKPEVDRSQKLMAVLPYVKGLEEKIRKELNIYEINGVFKAEHRRKSSVAKTLVAPHNVIHYNNHKLDENDFKLLDQESNWCKISIKEAIHIRKTVQHWTKIRGGIDWHTHVTTSWNQFPVSVNFWLDKDGWQGIKISLNNSRKIWHWSTLIDLWKVNSEAELEIFFIEKHMSIQGGRKEKHAPRRKPEMRVTMQIMHQMMIESLRILKAYSSGSWFKWFYMMP